ncbi:M24 family metallopeptidase [Helicobacter sp. 23-1046]
MQNYFTQDENAQYFETNFSCDNAIILRAGDIRIFITDSRYATEAKECVKKGVEVVESKELGADFVNMVKKLGIKELYFNPNEVSLSFYNYIAKLLYTGVCASECELKPAPNFHQKLRIIKDKEQIALIAKSQKLNRHAFRAFFEFIAKSLDKKRHLSEREMHFFASMFLSHKGKYELSFNPIVALNANGAKPHALPSKKAYCESGDSLLFDAGIKYKRYCSDRTRTIKIGEAIRFGKEQKFNKSKHQKIYDIVRKAQETCISKIRAGMKASEVDRLARDVIENAGYGKYFLHSTGHGIGLDIHELPIISSRSNDIIENGMVFSVEPGIYLAGEFGVRIEDLVVIENNRAQVL